jgi:acyl-CoA synthetase (AMP-forming)/AMP-acid ligase II
VTPAPRAPALAAHYRTNGWWDTRTLADGVEAAAVNRPAVVALDDGRRRLTWTELERTIAAGVDTLSELGVGSGTAVVLIGGNTTEAAVAFHAALRCGARVVLLDRRCGPADVAEALRVAPGATLVVGAGERDRLGDDAGVLPLERFAQLADTAPVATPEPDRDAPAVILFTSGTTGRPKAVVHSINTLTAGAANMAHITRCSSDDVLLLVSPLASITGVMHLLLSADQHATLVLEDEFNAEATLDRLLESHVTVLGGAPVIAERLLQAAGARGIASELPLRTLAVGGAMLPRPLLALATDRFGIEIARVYGSSEAPNHTGSAPGDDRDRRLADDGALMPGSEVCVGSTRHPEEGLVRGPAVFLGYLDPADDADAFEDGWFRTGDLVELHDGRLTVAGRIKEVVNRNGLKISPSEVDLALADLAGAAEAACFGLPDPETGERLVVAVRPLDDATISLQDVTTHLLSAGLAKWKLPEQLVLWDRPLPRTPTGKVVRARLAMETLAAPEGGPSK